MNGIGTQLLLNTPAIDLPHNLRFGLMDHEMLRSGCRLVDVGIPIGRIPPVDPALAGRKQLPAAGAFVDQGALILRKDALHLEEHLFFGACAQALMHEDDLTPPSGQLLDQNDLIGIAAGEAVRGRDQHDLKGAFGREIAQPLEGGPIQARPTDPVIDEDVARQDLIAVGRCRLLEQVHLTRDGFLPFLFLRGHTGIQGCPCQG